MKAKNEKGLERQQRERIKKELKRVKKERLSES